ncbi:MAG: diaminopimelate decarboxylase, partial [Deltaproteobacteria bacterium]
MPMSQSFKERLFPITEQLVEHYGSPFHIYDEVGIRETGENLKKLFSGVEGFREYYAVKALPNPEILKLMLDMGFGFDCSSIGELQLSRQLGARGEQIMFTSNNTDQTECKIAAEEGGCVLNLDDISL